MSGEIALYIHLPFCRRRCLYCSFASSAGRESAMPAYVAALKRELKERGRGETLRSIYLGGGTPSLLPRRLLGELFNTIRDIFNVPPGIEISMEANPGTVDADYLKAARESGVNRLSLGVQSFNDGELQMLGRIHTSAEAVQAVKAARAAGFDNLNLDLIYGLPGQSAADWRYSLEAALALAPEHLSLYALTLEEDVELYRMIEHGVLPEIDADAAADMYESAEDRLAAAGYVHYEISNWARPGRECRHNLVYWRNGPYLGAGAAAHSCRDHRRTANTPDLDAYIEQYSGLSYPALALDEAISPALELAETVILGLRLGEGVSLTEVNDRYRTDVGERYKDTLAEMTGAGLLERAGDRIRLTRRGRLLANQVFYRLLPGENELLAAPGEAVAIAGICHKVGIEG